MIKGFVCNVNHHKYTVIRYRVDGREPPEYGITVGIGWENEGGTKQFPVLCPVDMQIATHLRIYWPSGLWHRHMEKRSR